MKTMKHAAGPNRPKRQRYGRYGDRLPIGQKSELSDLLEEAGFQMKAGGFDAEALSEG